MNTSELKSNIQDLQRDVLELLNEISKLMGGARDTLRSDEEETKYGELQEDIKSVALNVKELELRMAVVAPMKAGKSTIINAIIGDNLLPHRNSAMTTIPTEIIFKAELEQPVLIISEHVRKAFGNYYSNLKQQITRLRKEGRLAQKIGQYPHLEELIREINESPNFLDSLDIVGRDNIGKVLARLNDIVRLASALEPYNDPIEQLKEVPRIETPYWSSKTAGESDNYGNLVIIDTPGPNESGGNLRLTDVVKEQLSKSSIVLIVLDFTQLNNRAAEEIKQQVKPVIDLLGKDNLYVLVNKVDQRRKQDMTPEQVKKFVFNDLDLSESQNSNTIFEVSAIQAFSAARFLRELQQYPDLELEDMDAIDSLAQEALGIRWQRKLAKANREEMQEEAEYLWKDSGFSLFLEKAITALMKSAALRCLQSALNVSRNHLIALRDDLKLKTSSVSQDIEKLSLEVDALENDLLTLESGRKKLKQIGKIRAYLERQLNQIIETIKVDAQFIIETFYNEEEYNQANWLVKREKNIKNVIDWLAQQVGVEIYLAPEVNILEFSTESEADKFINQAISFAKQRTENKLKDLRRQVEKIIEDKRSELTNYLEKEVKPIIKKSQNRLDKSFNIDLGLLLPNISSDNNMNIAQVGAQKNNRYVAQGYDTLTYTKRHWWYWIWLVPKKYTEHVKRPYKGVEYYAVSLEQLTSTFNHSLATSIEAINQEIIKYLDDDFKPIIDSYFENLDAYLSNYKNSLRRARREQKLSLNEKKHLTYQLLALLSESNKQIEQSNKLIERTKQV